MWLQTLEKTLVLPLRFTTSTRALISTCVQACCGKETSNLVGSASGTRAMSPTSRQTTCSRRNSGEIKKPTIGIPSSTATTAPANWVPRTANCRRLSRRGSRCAIAEKAVEHARGADKDEEQGNRNRAADQPEGERGLAVGLPVPPAQSPQHDEHEQERESHHDRADQRQIEEGLEITHQRAPTLALP